MAPVLMVVVLLCSRLGREREPALKITPPPKWLHKPCRLIAETFLNSASEPLSRRLRSETARRAPSRAAHANQRGTRSILMAGWN